MGCDHGSFNPGTCPEAFMPEAKIEKSHSVADFSIGDKVVWNIEFDPSFVRNMINFYGKGPFPVVGLRLLEKYGHKTQGHPLMVTIETPEGRRYDFSGQLFRKRPKRTS
ncbi:hypothetical protein A3F97_02980 [Candidatus Nomurabacteria bacterium RIFCSPLOWO2_12_FULL_41_10]|uniref:Uncharacterized protein n=1 Tax=Candidatus Nomurabacteria bacterium RIFCSPLOWO2_12_FULL_41_10 TaxID=1801795 RepID=A0A1F6YDG3_9BACT|nr:MAG: hypothetical protein A3F97_02980 [Candidatus Nomurabacteria bacterium RIFCSPLOWO2_12_FULL_41_10]